jgi:hypothetical protein
MYVCLGFRLAALPMARAPQIGSSKSTVLAMVTSYGVVGVVVQEPQQKDRAPGFHRVARSRKAARSGGFARGLTRHVTGQG